MGAIFIKSIWDRKISTFVVGSSLLAFAFLFVALFETIAGELTGYLDSFPAEFSAIIGDLSNATTPAGWLSIELYSLFVPFAVCIIAIIAGANAIGKEEDSGTLELLLASPISRAKLFTQKSLAILTQVAVIGLMTWLGVYIGSLLFEFDVNLANVLWASISAVALGALFGSIALATQAVTGKRAMALGVASGVLAIGYALNILSSLVESLEWVKFLSPFYYFNVEDTLSSGVDFTKLAVLVVLTIALYIIAHIWFAKRDTGV